jgi:hypothetical protein
VFVHATVISTACCAERRSLGTVPGGAFDAIFG